MITPDGRTVHFFVDKPQVPPNDPAPENLQAQRWFGRTNNKKSSHLTTDGTTDDLAAFGELLIDGYSIYPLKRRYIQYPGTPREHLDLNEAKFRIAVRRGAIIVTNPFDRQLPEGYLEPIPVN